MIQWMLAVWSLLLLPFLNPAWTSGSSWFTYCGSLAWRILCVRWVQLCSSLNILWHYLSLGLEWKLTFSSPVATAEFSQFAGILSGALSQHHLSGFENSSTGIPSPPLALFVVMLSKAHLTSHSRMSGSRWVITPSWLSGSWRSFLYSSSLYSCHLFLISSASLTVWKPLTVWLQQTVGNSEWDGNTRPPYLSSEKLVCRSRSNS